jgi:xanthosine utilization system XapX-like protein
MHTQKLIADIGVGLIGGYVGTKVMEPVAMKLYQWESEEARHQEDAVRPGPPYKIAARKTTELLGLKLSDQDIQKLGTTLFHYGLGMSWGPIYMLVRRRTDLNPAVAGLGTGAAMSLIVDEVLTPLFGFSAPNRAYPLVTHLRGVVAHLAFGLGIAVTAETLTWLGRRTGR